MAVKTSFSHGLYLAQIGANSLIGYVFARMLAYYFGASAEKDGFDIAYSVPFIVLNLSGFAYIHSVVTTQFAAMLAKKSDELDTVFSSLLTWMTLAGTVFLVAAAVFAGPLTMMLAPGLPAETLAETQHLLLLLLPLAVTLGVGAYLGAVLTAHDVPVTGELCQLASRVGVIVCVLAGAMHFELPHVAIGLVVSSVLGLGLQWIILCRTTSLRFCPTLNWHSDAFRSVIKQGSGFLVCAILAQVAMAYMRRQATLDGVGTNSALTYGFAIIIPLSLLLGKPLALTVGPRYARLAALENWAEARQLLMRASALTLMTAVIVSTLVSFFTRPIVRLMFGGGQFGEEAVAVTASLCVILAWALPGALLRWVIVMPSLSTRNSSLPGLIFAIGHVAHIGLTAVLFAPYGRSGLAIAYTASIILQAVVGACFLASEFAAVSRPGRDCVPPGRKMLGETAH